LRACSYAKVTSVERTSGVGLDAGIEAEGLDELVARVLELLLAACEDRAERSVELGAQLGRAAGGAAGLEGGAELLLGVVEAGLEVVVVERRLERLARLGFLGAGGRRGYGERERREK
jgi:hypothetical protein